MERIVAAVLAALTILDASGEPTMPHDKIADADSHGKMPPDLSSEATRTRIEKHRTAKVTLTVTDPSGRPLASVPVSVRMTRQQFLFGCNGFGLRPEANGPPQLAYRTHFTNLLNYATLPFYWGGFEREQGKPATERLTAQARWFREHGVTVKGHPLVWNMVCPAWLPSDVKEVRTLQESRVRRDVAAFKGVVDRWDAINEVVAWDRPQVQNPLTDLGKTIGDLDLVKLAFGAARKGNPQASLLINDFRMDAAYADLIRRCLAAGVTIDGIGLQSHMHLGSWSAETLWANLERFSGFGKPLHLTEVTLISGDIKKDMDWHSRYDDWPSTSEGEARQATDVERFYTVAFSHPALEAITWWDLADGAWLGAPSGLLRRDLSPKPAYEILHKLIRNDWWTREQTLTTDTRGRITFRAFLGDHEVASAAGRARFAVARSGSVAVAAQIR